MSRFLLSFGAALLYSMSAAQAFPDGAPWGSADPASPNNCASCHFDGEVQQDSSAILLTFGALISYGALETSIEPGQTIPVTLRFKTSEENSVGFLILSSAGTFVSTAENMNSRGQELRSMKPKAPIKHNDKNKDLRAIEVTWKFEWTAPSEPDGEIFFWVAVNESNDDNSSFGDRIHYKTIKKFMPGEFWFVPPT